MASISLATGSGVSRGQLGDDMIGPSEWTAGEESRALDLRGETALSPALEPDEVPRTLIVELMPDLAAIYGEIPDGLEVIDAGR